MTFDLVTPQGHLYLLVTDQGFLQEGGLVWESLHNVEGDGNFCDSDFRLCHPPQRSVPVTQPEDLTPQQQQRQIDQVSDPPPTPPHSFAGFSLRIPVI